jgi:hypothetical protein
VQAPYHPDPQVEALRWSVTEGALIQGIGRPRGVRRTVANPVVVTLLAATPLPLVVDEVWDWSEAPPGGVRAAAAEAAMKGLALPLAAADLCAARPDRFPSRRTAERALADPETANYLYRDQLKGCGGFWSQVPARYRRERRPGARRWSEALVPALAGRAALEALIGEVADFELLSPAAAEALAAPPIDPAPPPLAPEPPALAGALLAWTWTAWPPAEEPAPLAGAILAWTWAAWTPAEEPPEEEEPAAGWPWEAHPPDPVEDFLS